MDIQTRTLEKELLMFK